MEEQLRRVRRVAAAKYQQQATPEPTILPDPIKTATRAALEALVVTFVAEVGFCSICLENFPATPMLITPCGHLGCAHCLARALKDEDEEWTAGESSARRRAWLQNARSPSAAGLQSACPLCRDPLCASQLRRPIAAVRHSAETLHSLTNS
jgi:hypothetical protein